MNCKVLSRHKNIDMKIIFSLLFFNCCVIFSAHTQKLVSGQNDLGHYYLAIESESNLDTIRRFAFEICILDSKWEKDGHLVCIIEEPFDFYYYKLIKKDGRWVEELSSGSIAANKKNTRYFRSNPIASSFKILDIDIVQFSTLDGDFVDFNCDLIRQRNKAWKQKVEAQLQKTCSNN